MFRRIIFGMFLFLATQWVFADWHKHHEAVFGTDLILEFWSEDDEQAENTIKAVVNEMWRLHNSLSPWVEDSELSQINRLAAKETLEISTEMTMLLDKSLWFSQISDGAFDPTFASVGHRFNYREGIAPSDETVSGLTHLIDYRQVDLQRDAQTVRFLKPGIKIDLGGLAKGYAMDRAVNILTEHGVQNASISAGGDMRLLGDRLGRPWVMGIRNPRAEETAIRLPLENTAVSTSGDYERFFVDETGERIHHIIDPKTGESAKELASVTVLGEKGLDTDPLSTTVFVLGPEAGLSLIEKLEGFDAILIDTAGQVFFSSGLVSPE